MQPLTTHLVQRLIQPPPKLPDKPGASALDKLYKLSRVFGGGNLGISDAGWDIIQQAFDFDYMGAAEYEFGAVRDTLYHIAENHEAYCLFEFVIAAKDVQPGWWRADMMNALRRKEVREAKDRGEKPPRLNRKKLQAKCDASPVTDQTVYGFCLAGQRDQVIDLIRRIARDDRTINIKNGAGMGQALDPNPSYPGRRRVCGWLDLDNHAAWFLDKNMRDSAAAIFAISARENAA